jgi:hypothetical protein
MLTTQALAILDRVYARGAKSRLRVRPIVMPRALWRRVRDADNQYAMLWTVLLSERNVR